MQPRANVRDEVLGEFAEFETAAHGMTEFGTVRAGRAEKAPVLFRKHVVRLMIIDPVAATIAAMRWGNSVALTTQQIAELTGRSQSSVDSCINPQFARLELLERSPTPDPSKSYALARLADVPQPLAAFAFWFNYTLSAARAAELSGHGLAGPTKACERVLDAVASVAKLRTPLAAWHAKLVAIKATTAKIQAARVASAATSAMVSTTLGKRRKGLNPRTPAPIDWLDGHEVAAAYAALPAPAAPPSRAKQKANDAAEEAARAPERHAARQELGWILENEPENAITTALRFVLEGMPYYDLFRGG